MTSTKKMFMSCPNCRTLHSIRKVDGFSDRYECELCSFSGPWEEIGLHDADEVRADALQRQSRAELERLKIAPENQASQLKQIAHELAELRKALDARPTSWQLFWVIVLAGIAISAATEIMRGLVP